MNTGDISPSHEQFSLDRHKLITRIIFIAMALDVITMIVVSFHGQHSLAYWVLGINFVLVAVIWWLFSRHENGRS